MSSGAWLTPRSPSATPSAGSRSSPSPRTRTTRTTNACRSWSTNCRTRSSHTRSRSKRLRRSRPSTWPSSARCRPTSSRQRSAPTSTSRCWPGTRPRAEAPAWPPCNRSRQHIYFLRSQTCCSTTIITTRRGLFRVGAESVPGAVSGSALSLHSRLRQRIRKEQRTSACVRSDLRHRSGLHSHRRFECDRTVDYQFLLGLLRSDQLLHFPRRSHPTAGLATHLQILQQMAECARQCSIRGRHVPLQLAHRSHHIRCHLLPLLPRQIPKTRCQLGLVDAGPGLQNGPDHDTDAQHHQDPREDLHPANPGHDRIAQHASIPDRFRLPPLQKQLTDDLRRCLSGTHDPPAAQDPDPEIQPLAAHAQNQSLLQSGGSFTLL